jgi:hypothetical protein
MKYYTLLTSITLLLSAVVAETTVPTIKFNSISNITLGANTNITWTTAANASTETMVLQLYSFQPNHTWVGGWDFGNDVPLKALTYQWSVENTIPEGQYYIEAVDRATQKQVFGKSESFFIQQVFTASSLPTSTISLAVMVGGVLALIC